MPVPALPPEPIGAIKSITDDIREAVERRAREERREDAARVTEATLRKMIRAGNRIARRPYVYGGGHGSFRSAGYDCSGSLSYVLHAAGLLDTPLASGALASYGKPGKGKHVTIYANAGHAFMVIDDRRFDTTAFKASGTRWSKDLRGTEGYTARHPAGL